MEHFREFCKHTSLHGWRYMSDDSKLLSPKSIFWFCIVCCTVIVATILIYFNTINFINATVLITVETMTAPLSEIFFPSIAVCNINQARKSFFDEIGIDNGSIIRKIHSQYIGESITHDTVSLPSELIKTLNEIESNHSSLNWAIHQRCQDMFIQSNWNGSTYDNRTEIDYDFGTDYGICCWFTPQLNYTEIVRRYK